MSVVQARPARGAVVGCATVTLADFLEVLQTM